MEAVASEGGACVVDFTANVKKFVRTGLPDFAFRNAPLHPDFVRTAALDAELCLRFKRPNHIGPGKAYTLDIGIRLIGGAAAGQSFWSSLFEFFDHGPYARSPQWVYKSTGDLAECLNESRRLLDLVLPDFEQACWRHLWSPQRRLPESAEFGALSFLEASVSQPPLSQRWIRHLQFARAHGSRLNAGDIAIRSTQSAALPATGRDGCVPD
jgi:hypothetical protein